MRHDEADTPSTFMRLDFLAIFPDMDEDITEMHIVYHRMKLVPYPALHLLPMLTLMRSEACQSMDVSGGNGFLAKTLYDIKEFYVPVQMRRVRPSYILATSCLHSHSQVSQPTAFSRL